MHRMSKTASVLVAGLGLAAGALGLSGCASSVQGKLISQTMEQLRGDGDFPRTRAEVSAYPYAQLGVRVDGNRAGIPVLIEYVGQDYLWGAGDVFRLHQARDGRIKYLRLPETETWLDWGTVTLQPEPPAEFIVGLRAVATNGDAIERPMRCVLEQSEPATIIINTYPLDTMRSQYRCDSAPTSPSVVMTYWHDAQGRIRRTEGQLWEQGNHLFMEALKVPA